MVSDLKILIEHLSNILRGPGATAPVLADGNVQPKEGGEEEQRAASPGAVPLRLLHPDVRRPAGGRPLQPRAPLLLLPPAHHPQAGHGGLLRPAEPREWQSQCHIQQLHCFRVSASLSLFAAQ